MTSFHTSSALQSHRLMNTSTKRITQTHTRFMITHINIDTDSNSQAGLVAVKDVSRECLNHEQSAYTNLAATDGGVELDLCVITLNSCEYILLADIFLLENERLIGFTFFSPLK